MNRVLVLALVASAAAAGYFVADPPVNLQASSPGSQQTGNTNISGTMIAGKVSATNSGATAQVIVGDATATTGANFGGLFKTASTTGTGIRGVANATTGGGNGGTFQTAGPTGAGVRGFSTALTGENYGVFGQAVSSTGFAGYFQGRMKVTSDAIIGGILSGNGSGLTALNASNLATGTVASTRLASDVALTSKQNFFGLTQGFPAGSAAEPALTIFGSGNGLFAPTGASIGFASGGSEQMRLNSTGLGINNTSPDRRLHIVGDSPATFPSYATTADMVIEDAGSTGLQMISNGSTFLTFGNSNASGRFNFAHNPASSSFSIQCPGAPGTQIISLDGINNRMGLKKLAPTTTLDVVGTITGTTKNFLIDDPRDPLHSTLRHACVESDEYKNVYDGVATTDANGYATITLPDWFDALNEKFRYQLTVLDDSEEFILSKVTQKIADNRFTIRTSRPIVEVSWMVTGVRKDAYVRDNPLKVEEIKEKEQKGKLLYERSEKAKPTPSRK